MRSLALLAALVVAAGCAHQPRPSQPLPELPRYSLQSRLADVPEDEGSGGYLPSVPYYVAHETLAQAEAPVGADGWLARAFNYTATAPQGATDSKCLVEGGTGSSGVCLGGYPGAGNQVLYLAITPSTRTTGNWVLRSDGYNSVLNANGTGSAYLRKNDAAGLFWSGSAFTPETPNTFDLGTGAARFRDGYFSRTLDLSTASGSNAISLSTNGARVDLGTGANDYLYSDGTGIQTPGQITVVGRSYFRGYLGNDSSGQPLFTDDAEGFQLASTAALPTCAASLEGTFKRDGTTGAASTARTRVCLCTSDGAASPAYAWVNAVSGTVGTATTCAP